MPTPVRTALCSAIMPPTEGYSTGMSQPLNSTIFAPIWRWTALSAVLRIAGVVASTTDKCSSIKAVAGLPGVIRLITLTWRRRALQQQALGVGIQTLQASGFGFLPKAQS